MRIDDYLIDVQNQVESAAALGDDRTRQIAVTLASAITPAVRLAIISALSAAADEVTAALLDTPGSPIVSVQLDGGDVRVDVRTVQTPASPAASVDEGDASARISLRLSESLKADVETAARRDGVSVNSWLIRAATRSLASNSPVAAIHDAIAEARRQATNAHRVSGWLNG